MTWPARPTSSVSCTEVVAGGATSCPERQRPSSNQLGLATARRSATSAASVDHSSGVDACRPLRMASDRAASSDTFREASRSAWARPWAGPSRSLAVDDPDGVGGHPQLVAGGAAHLAGEGTPQDVAECRGQLGCGRPAVHAGDRRVLVRRGGAGHGDVEEPEQVVLGLDDPAADGCQLERRDRAVQVAAGLGEADDGPLERPRDLPPAHGVVVERPTRRRLVRRQPAIAVGEVTGGAVPVEPPRPDDRPGDVLHRIAEVGELPVEDGAEPGSVDHRLPIRKSPWTRLGSAMSGRCSSSHR